MASRERTRLECSAACSEGHTYSWPCELSPMPPERTVEPDWWDRIGHMGWQHMVLVVLAAAAFVALSFAPMCSIHISSGTPNTTTTTGG